MGLEIFDITRAGFSLDLVDAEPYLKNYLACDVVAKMKKLSDRGALTADRDIPMTVLLHSAYVLSNCAAQYSVKEGEYMFRVPKDIVDEECRNILKDYPDFLYTLEKKVNQTPSDDPKYADYMELYSLMSIMYSTVQRAEAVSNVRKIRLTESDLKPAIDEYEKFLEDEDYRFDDPTWEEGDSDVAAESSNHTSDEVMQHRVVVELKAYRTLLDKVRSFDEEMESLNAQIHEVDSELSPFIKSHFEGANGLGDYYNRTNTLYEQKSKVQDTLDGFSKQITDHTKKYLDAHHIKGIDSNLLYSQCGSIFFMLSAGRSQEEIEKFIGDITEHQATPEMCQEIIAFHSANLHVYEECQEKLRFIGDEIDQLGKVWKRAELEQKKLFLADRFAADYQRRRADAIRSLPEGIMNYDHNSLRVWINELDKTSKIGFNSTEYKDFRKALKDAVAGGDLQALAKAAKTYVTEKEKGHEAGWQPSSLDGRNRLRIAKQIQLMTENALEGRKHPTIPAAEEAAPIRRIDEIDFSNLDDEIIDTELVDNYNYPQEQEATVSEQAVPAQTEPEENADSYYGSLPSPSRLLEEAMALPEDPNRPRKKPIENNSMEIIFCESLNAPDLPSAPLEIGANKPYISSGIRNLDEAHEFFYPVFISRMVFDECGYDPERCREIATQLMAIVDNNLSGNFNQDIKNAYEEFKQTFLLPHGDQPAIIPGYAGRDFVHRSFMGVYGFINEYDSWMSTKVEAEREANADKGKLGRERLMQKQMQAIEEKYTGLAQSGYLSQENCKTLIDLAKDPNCSFQQRNFLLLVSPESLSRVENACPNHADFKKGFTDLLEKAQNYVSDVRHNNHEQFKQYCADTHAMQARGKL